MTRSNSLLVLAIVAAIAVVPSGAQTFHFTGAGSSAQFTMAAIAADQAALTLNGGKSGVHHWSAKTAAQVTDTRDARILPEPGNIWIVWVETGRVGGGGTVTHVWSDISVDSTVGVRTVLAQLTSGSGALSQLTVAAGTAAANLIQACSSNTANLWPDKACDVATLPAELLAAFGGQCSAGTQCTFGQHLNVGLTDIRPEDALFATTRAYSAINTATYKGLGYVGPTKSIGAPIYSQVSASATHATPIGFALPGGSDPISHKPVSANFVTIPVGAAPIVFVYNNAGAASYPGDLKSGVKPGQAGGTYEAAHLFDGTTACTNLNPAFDSFIGGTPASTNITVFLREPLSGTMNTTEFSLFRTFGNTNDSQEKGVITPTRAPYNPLNLACHSGGSRLRGIGTGEVLTGVSGTANSIGYVFWSFSNAAKLQGTNYNYLTLDGVDPIGLPESLTGNGAQNLPNCNGTQCPSSLWTGSSSFPSLRNGTYKAWSIYRWVTEPNSDPSGPQAVAQYAQDYVDREVADFVPFVACPLSDFDCSSSIPTDGLSVYHSHFTQSAKIAKNGAATPSNSFNHGNTLGTWDGVTESGGDMGGLIEGPFYNPDALAGTVNTTSVLTSGKGYKVTWVSGNQFPVNAAIEGGTITIHGIGYTIANVLPTATTLYVSKNPKTQTNVAYSAHVDNKVSAPGVLNKKQ